MSEETKVAVAKPVVKETTQDLLKIFKKSESQIAELAIKNAKIEKLLETNKVLVGQREINRAFNIKVASADLKLPNEIVKNAYFTESMKAKLAELQK